MLIVYMGPHGGVIVADLEAVRGRPVDVPAWLARELLKRDDWQIHHPAEE